MIGQFLSTYNCHLYSRWSLVTHSSAPQYCPLASCFWGYFSPHSSPSRRCPQGPHPDFPHIWSMGKKKKPRLALKNRENAVAFSCLPHQSMPPPCLSHFPGVGAIRSPSPVPPNWGGSHSKHFGFEGSKSGRTDLGRFPLMFYINQCILGSFV